MNDVPLTEVLHNAGTRVAELFGGGATSPPIPSPLLTPAVLTITATAQPEGVDPSWADILHKAGGAVGVALATTQADATQPAPAPYRAKATSLWRRLDEERQHHRELAAEFDVEIEALTAKRDDALQAAAMAEAGMRAADVAS